MLFIAAQNGITPEQFWRMSWVEFVVFVKGNQQQQSQAGFYFRENYALLYNIHRGEKVEALTGADVLPLPGDKSRKHRAKANTPAYFKLSGAEQVQYMAYINKRFNSTPEEWKEYVTSDPYAIKRYAQEHGPAPKNGKVSVVNDQPPNAYPEETL